MKVVYLKYILFFWLVSLYGGLSAQVKDVQYYNRYTKKMEKEKIVGKNLIKFLSQNRFGQKIITRTGERVSKLMGKWNDLPASANKVGQFVRDYSISMNEFVIPDRNNAKTLGYKSFNHFFTRHSKKRGEKEDTQGNFKNKKTMIAFADARYFGFNKWNSKKKVPVKGHMVDVMGLLGRKGREYKDMFEGGPMVIASWPVDYHRYHFPVGGKVVESWDESGPLYSVSPLALSRKQDILFTNKRRITVVDSPQFGHLAYVEIGATGVGAMEDTFKTKPKSFSKGPEKRLLLNLGARRLCFWETSAESGKSRKTFWNKQKKGTEVFIEFGDKLGRTAY